MVRPTVYDIGAGCGTWGLNIANDVKASVLVAVERAQSLHACLTSNLKNCTCPQTTSILGDVKTLADNPRTPGAQLVLANLTFPSTKGTHHERKGLIAAYLQAASLVSQGGTLVWVVHQGTAEQMTRIAAASFTYQDVSWVRFRTPGCEEGKGSRFRRVRCVALIMTGISYRHRVDESVW